MFENGLISELGMDLINKYNVHIIKVLLKYIGTYYNTIVT